MLQGLGARFIDAEGNELPGGGAALARLESIDFSAFDPRLDEARFVLASDVDNPLLGPDSAARGLWPAEGGIRRRRHHTRLRPGSLCGHLSQEIGPRALKAAGAPGAGAAGGVGYAAIAVLAATRRPGIDVVLEFTALADRLQGADLVITGEGSLDEQSLLGKTPMGVARAAALAGVPVIAVCGRTTLPADQLLAAGFQSTYALTEIEANVETCMAEAGRLLEKVGAIIGARLATDSPAKSASPKKYLDA